MEMLEKLDHEDKVLLLKKSLYDLCQAGRCWHAKLSEGLQDFRFIQFTYDP